jgi:hypothetical protein
MNAPQSHLIQSILKKGKLTDRTLKEKGYTVVSKGRVLEFVKERPPLAKALEYQG